MATSRGWGKVQRMRSGRWQASYAGPDLRRYTAPSTFDTKIDAERWLAHERDRIEADTWTPPKLRMQEKYSRGVDRALAFLLEHLPSQMHLVIATREDPRLPLARWRARGRLTELRAADLRFTPFEAAEFLNRVMGLELSAEDVGALESRTEGWITGLQLAAHHKRKLVSSTATST